VLVNDRVVQQIPQWFATGIYLMIWNISGMALRNLIIQGLAIFLHQRRILLKPLLKEMEPVQSDDYSSKKEVYNGQLIMAIHPTG